MDKNIGKKVLFVGLLLLSGLPFINGAMSLMVGIAFSLILHNPWEKESSIWSKRLLQISVIGIGFNLSLIDVWNVGTNVLIFIIIGISFILLLGNALGKFFKINDNTSTLISVGTAICGGSAIATIAPILKSKDEEIATSMSIVFILNSLALILFPYIGHLIHLNQVEFGLWAALSIHDTSSVVGASAIVGCVALSIATMVKLTRALFIIPLSIGTIWIKKSTERTKFPLFILGFICAIILRTTFPQFMPLWIDLFSIARQGLVMTLFLIGSRLSINLIKTIGLRPLGLGVILWILTSGLSLIVILNGWIL